MAASQMPKVPHALVIGGGLGGMAAAMRLRARGYRVSVLEQADRLGGRARIFEHKGFCYDAGPTVVTAPFLIDELFALGGQKRQEAIELLRVDPWYRFHFPDGEHFDYGGTKEATLAEVARLSPGDTDGYLRLLAHSRRICDLAFERLAHRPFDRALDMLRLVPHLVRLGGYRSVQGMVAHYVRHPYLQRALCIHPLLIGGDPYRTTAIYTLIHAVEDQWGIWYPAGGMGALVSAIGRLLEMNGVAVRLSTRVTEIRVEGRRATGVKTADGEAIRADLVVANADPPAVYRGLIPARNRRRWTDRRIEALHYSMGLFVLYFATRRSYPGVPQHSVLLGKGFRSLLRDVFDRRRLSSDLSLYLHRPSATDPTLAPAGSDLFYALVPVPNLQAPIDWGEAGDVLRERVLGLLDSSLLPGVRDALLGDFFITPREFRDLYLSHRGTGFSIAPRLTQSAWFRFHNRSEDIEGLYFVGAGTHPGAGIPGVLSSAKVLDSLLPAAGHFE